MKISVLLKNIQSFFTDVLKKDRNDVEEEENYQLDDLRKIDHIIAVLPTTIVAEKIFKIITLAVTNSEKKIFESISERILTNRLTYDKKLPFSLEKDIMSFYEIIMKSGKVYAISIFDPYDPYLNDELMWFHELDHELSLSDEFKPYYFNNK